jgi:hypothetical protein
LTLAQSGKSLACDRPEYKFTGVKKVDEKWLRDYLSLDHRVVKSESDLSELRAKILTTDIFTAVDIKASDDLCQVDATLSEKWTTIPVIRGAYGGGTPLMIVGGYETNAFGQLLAVGAEARRYGNMAPGAFFFFKSPRAWRGRGSWGGELWLDRRRRSFFDSDQIQYGYADNEAWTAKLQWLIPMSDEESSHFQAGFQAQGFQEKKTTFHLYPDTASKRVDSPHDLIIEDRASTGGVFAPMLAYDDLRVNGLNLAGIKARAMTGAIRSGRRGGNFSESEGFFYWLPAEDLNLAAHFYGAATTQNTVGGVYYLGGFDSVRGLPDGIRYGNRIAYGNFEARLIATKFKFAHIQPAVFYDTGSAWMNDHDPASARETSVGTGVRIAIPQIYRFVIRIDYGRSIGTTKSAGLSVGLNQFFQPYKMTF